MSTKLEAMVDFLSGREGDPRLLDELADPSSEASRFLESTRERSRALLEDPTIGRTVDRPRLPLRWLAIAALIAIALAAFSLISWLAADRLRRLESTLARAEAESKAKDLRLDAALSRIAESRPSLDPIAEALGRVEAGLARLERRVESIEIKPASVTRGRSIHQMTRSATAWRRSVARSRPPRRRTRGKSRSCGPRSTSRRDCSGSS